MIVVRAMKGNGIGRWAAMVVLVGVLSGCSNELSYRDLRVMGQEQMIQHNYGAAQRLFKQAMEKVPEDAWNLYDLGDCSMHLANEQFRLRNAAAALRYVDHAVDFYSRAINAKPGMEPALWGKNMALEAKQRFEAALAVAKWAVQYVTPTARQQIFLARELEERADPDGALLRYRQAVELEPGSAYAHAELGRFYVRIGRKAEARDALLTAYRLDPTEPGVLDALRELGATPASSDS
jgi:tetratricopeptide (TPR) repeat protein